MLSIKRFATASAIAVLFVVPISFSAEAQTAAPTAIATVSVTSAAACNSAFGSDVPPVLSTITTAMLSQPNMIGTVAMKLISLRYKYEDLNAPAGCETKRQTLLRLIGFNEDALYANLGIDADSSHASLYTDFLSTNWQPRFTAFSASLKSPTAVATAQAAISNLSSASASAVCTDKTLSGQISADVGGFPNLPALSQSTVNTYGTAGITVIKIRYTYEDEHTIGACAIGLNDGKQFMALSEDTILLNLLGFTDSANVTTYESFRTANVLPREESLAKRFNNDIGFATLVPPTATAGS